MPNEKLTQLQQAMVEHDDDMARLDRNTMPTAKTTITVEAALAELRELFPQRMVDIQIRTGPNAKYVRIDVWSLGFMRDAPTLAEAIMKCRTWKEPQ